MKVTNPEMIRAVTKEWSGDRDANGHPLVSDDILERMKLVTTEEAWGTWKRNDYHFQFAGNWMNLHPGRVIVGRAVTCRWVPRRPDIHESIDKQGDADNRVGFQNSWVMDELGQLRVREGVYKPGEVDRKFSDEMNKDFEDWEASRPS
jgi:hypothetical protein